MLLFVGTGSATAQSREAGGWIVAIETCLKAMQMNSVEPFESWSLVRSDPPSCGNCEGISESYLHPQNGTQVRLDFHRVGEISSLLCSSDSGPEYSFSSATTGPEIRAWVQRQISNLRFFELTSDESTTHVLAICPKDGRAAELSISIITQYGEGFSMWNYPEDQTPCQLLLS